MLVLDTARELPTTGRIWGTGGWFNPAQREALDWLTLGGLCGWNVQLAHPDELEASESLRVPANWMVVTGDPDKISARTVAALRRVVETQAVSIVVRSGVSGSAVAEVASVSREPDEISGRSLDWTGPGAGRSWQCRGELSASLVRTSTRARVWATLDGAPIVVATNRGPGTIVTLGFHPSEARDAEGVVTSLLRHLLVSASTVPVAWLDLESTMVLRMDDPGSCEQAYREEGFCTKLGEADWSRLGSELKERDARLSIGYVSGWVDDGQADRGQLKVSGRRPPRVPGSVFPSPRVRYEVLQGSHRGAVVDYESEYSGIRSLESDGRASVELHGYTHVHPDAQAWACAEDRYEAVAWYRELGRAAAASIVSRPQSEHPLVLGREGLRRFFGTDPTTLICPGDEWTNEVLELALDLGLRLVSSYYLALRIQDRFCWATHVCAPYLDEPDVSWLDSGLPVIGYFHDFDVVRNGVEWLPRCLDSWHAVGVRRLIDFRGLAAALSIRLRTSTTGGTVSLDVDRLSDERLDRPIRILFRTQDGSVPSSLTVNMAAEQMELPVFLKPHGVGRITLPARRS